VAAEADGRPGAAAADAADLDRPRADELDRGDMLGAVAALPRQLTAGHAAAAAELRRLRAPGRPTAVVVCGMGGSAIGGDLVLAALPELPVPAQVVRGYRVPAWTGPGTLVIAVSYSGDTEETLACTEQARHAGATVVCVSSGGRLAALAETNGQPLLRVPGGGQPRAAVGSLAAPLLATLAWAGLCPGGEEDVEEAAALLRDGNDALAVGVPEAANAAKRLARRSFQRQVVVYGAGLTVPAARRWKGQVNENAKAPAFFNELPELDHNELMGWTSLPGVSAASLAVFLEDEREDPRLRRRAELTARGLAGRGVAVERVGARGGSRLARLFSLVQLGDYASVYLALLYGVDPTPVGAIQELKAELAGGAAR
jgi:glucose/mannose-6-phosphate isomerase